MKKATYSALFLVLGAGVFLAGSWYGQRVPVTPATTRQPESVPHGNATHAAHIAYTPGNAEAAGMSSNPVHVHGGIAALGGSPVLGSPGTVEISHEKQQLLGVQVRPAAKASDTQTLRFLGRVAPDETRVYRLNAGIEGFIRDVSAVTTGSQVKKDQQLATFSSPNALAVIQVYILNLGAVDRIRQSAAAGSVEAQAAPAGAANIRQRIDQLENLGMSVLQLEEISRTREVPSSIKILAPADGVVLARNVSPGLKFDRGAEWYRIADLRQVWIVADVFTAEAKHLRPGLVARVTLPDDPEMVLHARVTQVQPQFDANTRTLKVRLEADNPRVILRPDMLVDLEVPVTRPPAITVPVDAVVDSGAKKTVYVTKGDGVFEPRKVETGWRAGGHVEIVQGLMPGEQIAVSGTFLLDSESRMKAAIGATGHMHEGHAHTGGATPTRASLAVAHAPALVKDPVCGMDVDQVTAKAASRTAEYDGQIYVFCSDECQGNFAKEPAKYSRKVGQEAATPAGKRLQKVQWAGGETRKDGEAAHASHSDHQHP
jgi:Cu(I)/Ag(I) efflux system membrane fusion protein